MLILIEYYIIISQKTKKNSPVCIHINNPMLQIQYSQIFSIIEQMASKLNKAHSVQKNPPKLTEEDLKKIQLPRCSSLYSQFHYKVGRKDLEELIHNKHQLVICNLQALRVKDAKLISDIKQENQQLKNKIEQLNIVLERYQDKMKEFVKQKMQRVQQEVKKIISDVGCVQEIGEKQFTEHCSKIILNYSDYSRNFSIEEVDSLLNQLISQTVKKSFNCDQITENLIFKLQAIIAVNEKQIFNLNKQNFKLLQQLSDYQTKLQNQEQIIKELQPYLHTFQQSKSMTKYLQEENMRLKQEKEELQMWKKRTIEEEKREHEMQQNYIKSLNEFSGKFMLTGASAIKDFLKDQLNLKQQYNKLDNKSLQILYKQKISFILHLFRKFEHKNLEINMELVNKINYLEHEISSQNLFINKQTKIIKQAQIKPQSIKMISEKRIRIKSKKKLKL